jgi:mannose-1-phosphate guanylyltransferase
MFWLGLIGGRMPAALARIRNLTIAVSDSLFDISGSLSGAKMSKNGTMLLSESLMAQRSKQQNTMLHVIILAGGSGARLWPASRKDKPKHLLVFENQQTLLQATLERLTGLVPSEQIWIVTNQEQADQVADSLPHFDTEHFDTEHIWAEPFSRNTAPSIGWAAVKLRQIDPDAVMVVLPADHIIKPASVFRQTILCAADIVQESPETLVTIGVKPTFPATTYGYIRRGEVEKKSKCAAFHVLQFCEKPKQETAEKFFQSGEYFWNAGIFVWKAETILELLTRFEPEMGVCLRRIGQSVGTAEEVIVTAQAFAEIKSISIDYAVMERAENVVVLEA